jgi:hypothetical protein
VTTIEENDIKAPEILIHDEPKPRSQSPSPLPTARIKQQSEMEFNKLKTR